MFGPPPGLNFRLDGLGNDISGQELRRASHSGKLAVGNLIDPLISLFDGGGVIVLEHLRDIIEHEPLPISVRQSPSFPTDSLGDEDPSNRGWPDHSGRVELNELHVTELSSGFEGKGMPVSCVFP